MVAAKRRAKNRGNRRRIRSRLAMAKLGRCSTNSADLSGYV